MMFFLTILAGVALFAQWGSADPIWPSSIDELEDIMFLNSGFRKSGFADAVTPCGFSAAGPGRITAAEWIRTAFHDMATGTIFFGGSGGLDASIMFETERSENIGAAFNSSLAFFANYYSTRVSVSDLIALSVYTAVRSCGGPIVTIRAGRIDATVAGPMGVPIPQNPVGVFENQFARTGFTPQDMIEMTACGHTVGGVHAEDFPGIVPPGTAPNNYMAIDSSIAVFDNRIAVEWIAGNTTDPMSVGPSVKATQDSDAVVFGADGNVTMKALTDPATFASSCSSILQRMIEVVPPNVVFTDPLQPYEVKPTDLQLTLLSGGTSISFTGFIRVRTTVRPASKIVSVKLIYLDRNGASSCGSCTITTSPAGTSNGFDDSFAFYSFSSTLPSDSSISSFNVLITLIGSSTELHNNGGTGYPVQDSIMLQSPQSCLNGNGDLTVVAAVRNDRISLPVSLNLILMVPRQGVIVPALQSSSFSMVEGPCVGPYNLYSVSYAIPPSQALTAKFDVLSGTNSSSIADAFKSTVDLSATCLSLSSLGASCGSSTSSTSSGTSSSSSTSSTSSSSSTKTTSSSTSSTTSSSTSSKSSSSSTTTSTMSSTSSTSTTTSSKSSSTSPTTSTTSTSSSKSSSSTTSTKSSTSSSKSSATPSQTAPAVKSNVANYTYYGCWTEATSTRALSSSTTANDNMTLEECSAFCNGYLYWGTEYTRECYCGNSFNAGSTKASVTDCSMPCGGDSLEYCGGPRLLSVYALNTTLEPPTPTPAIKPKVGPYTYYGCQTEATNMRALSSATTATDSMTLELCESFCAGYKYWGVEYGRECYCGNSFNAGSNVAPASDCWFFCPGNDLEFCGAGNRLSTYVLT